jgi:hypothetical protein
MEEALDVGLSMDGGCCCCVLLDGAETIKGVYPVIKK